MKQFSVIIVAMALFAARCEIFGVNRGASDWNPCHSREPRSFIWGSWDLWRTWCHKKDQSSAPVQQTSRLSAMGNFFTSLGQYIDPYVQSSAKYYADNQYGVHMGLGAAIVLGSGYAVYKIWQNRHFQAEINSRKMYEKATRADFQKFLGQSSEGLSLATTKQLLNDRLKILNDRFAIMNLNTKQAQRITTLQAQHEEQANIVKRLAGQCLSEIAQTEEQATELNHLDQQYQVTIERNDKLQAQRLRDMQEIVEREATQQQLQTNNEEQANIVKRLAGQCLDEITKNGQLTQNLQKVENDWLKLQDNSAKQADLVKRIEEQRVCYEKEIAQLKRNNEQLSYACKVAVAAFSTTR